jgi:hypothetical protein
MRESLLPRAAPPPFASVTARPALRRGGPGHAASDTEVTPRNDTLLPGGLLLITHRFLRPQSGAPVTGELIESGGVLSTSNSGQPSFDTAPTSLGTGRGRCTGGHRPAPPPAPILRGYEAAVVARTGLAQP